VAIATTAVPMPSGSDYIHVMALSSRACGDGPRLVNRRAARDAISLSPSYCRTAERQQVTPAPYRRCTSSALYSRHTCRIGPPPPSEPFPCTSHSACVVYMPASHCDPSKFDGVAARPREVTIATSWCRRLGFAAANGGGKQSGPAAALTPHLGTPKSTSGCPVSASVDLSNDLGGAATRPRRQASTTITDPEPENARVCSRHHRATATDHRHHGRSPHDIVGPTTSVEPDVGRDGSGGVTSAGSSRVTGNGAPAAAAASDGPPTCLGPAFAGCSLVVVLLQRAPARSGQAWEDVLSLGRRLEGGRSSMWANQSAAAPPSSPFPQRPPNHPPASPRRGTTGDRC
jgi:hypothetical protein